MSSIPLVRDRVGALSLLIVLSFVSVLSLGSQSAASYATYALSVFVIFSWKKWNDILSIPLFWMIAALVVYLCMSGFWSTDPTTGEIFSIVVRGILVICFVIACAESQQRGDVQVWLGRSLAVVGTLACSLALLAHIQDADSSRLIGLGQLDNEVIAGLIFGVVLLLMLNILFYDTSKVWRFIAVVSIAVLAAAIYLTDSRNAWFSTSLGVVLFTLAVVIEKRQVFTILCAAGAVLIVVAGTALYLDEGTRYFLFPRGDSYRVDIWSETLHRLTESSVWFGHGILTNDSIQVGEFLFDHPHSMYLSVLFQGGAFGLLLFLCLIGFVVAELIRSYARRESKLAIGIIGLALAAWLMDGHALIDKVGDTWFLFWLPVAIGLSSAWSRAYAREARIEP